MNGALSFFLCSVLLFCTGTFLMFVFNFFAYLNWLDDIGLSCLVKNIAIIRGVSDLVIKFEKGLQL